MTCSPANHATGEDIDIKGPTGEITYLGNGRFRVNDDEFKFDKVGRGRIVVVSGVADGDLPA